MSEAFPLISTGSPPHTRGLQIRYQESGAGSGFSPAYTGTTAQLCHYAQPCLVFPAHAGMTYLVVRTAQPGPVFPRTLRGRKRSKCEMRNAKKVSPAHAGTNPRWPARRTGAWVFPRVRGDDTCTTETSFSRLGSPPHTRGRPTAAESHMNNIRFSPAYAGTTKRSFFSIFSLRGFPRARGDAGE